MLLSSVVILLSELRSAPSTDDLADVGLSRRESQVLRLAAIGKDNGEISSELRIAVGTVRKHLERIYAKLGVHRRAEAVTRALGATLPPAA